MLALRSPLFPFSSESLVWDLGVCTSNRHSGCLIRKAHRAPLGNSCLECGSCGGGNVGAQVELSAYPISHQHLGRILVFNLDNAWLLNPGFPIHLHRDTFFTNNSYHHLMALPEKEREDKKEKWGKYCGLICYWSQCECVFEETLAESMNQIIPGRWIMYYLWAFCAFGPCHLYLHHLTV